ncbi:MAG: hypothetical protein RL105_331 [Verrucomicrobiota bacterium]
MSGAAVSEIRFAAEVWREERRAHEARVAALTAPRLARAALGRPDPVEDFLFTYYPFRPSALRRWSPGRGVALADAAELADGARFERRADGLVSVVAPDAKERERLAFSLRLCRAVAGREARHACFGLHEWAMVFADADGRRHRSWPLRLGPEGTDRVVRSLPLRCTHYDAYRFFTPAARPLNQEAPTLEARADNEQPGCVHANMDLYKWAMKASPWIPSALAADCFELAAEARLLDMRASPYDFSAVGLEPVRIETPEGRAEYETSQRAVMKKAEPLRLRLISALERALAD